MLGRIRAWLSGHPRLEDALEVRAATQRDLAQVDAQLHAVEAGDLELVAELTERRRQLTQTLAWADEVVAAAERHTDFG